MCLCPGKLLGLIGHARNAEAEKASGDAFLVYLLRSTVLGASVIGTGIFHFTRYKDGVRITSGRLLSVRPDLLFTSATVGSSVLKVPARKR